MARDSSGTKNQPQYLGTGAPATAADQNEIANYAADVGNRKVKTAAERAALSGADVWDGLEVFESDTGRTYIRIGGGWKRTEDKISLVIVEKDVAQNTSSGTVTVTLNSTGAVVDTDTYYSTGANTRITVPLTGLYEVTYKIRTNGALALLTDLKVNGTAVVRGQSADIGATGASSTAQATVILNLTAADYITIDVTSTGVAAILTTGACFIQARYLGQA